MPISDHHLTALVRAVWGSFATIDDGPIDAQMLAVPDRAHAHQLLPRSPRAILAAASRRSDDRPLRRRLRDAVGVGTLLGESVVRPARRVAVGSANAAIAEVLRFELGLNVHSIVVLAGPARANQKPVVQALDRSGRTIAFAKLAWNPLTHALLDAEDAALTRLADAALAPVQVPAVLGRGVSDRTAWLALSPVAADSGPRRGRLTPRDAARAIESSLGITEQPFSTVPSVRSLGPRAAGLARSEAVVAAVVARGGEIPVRVGAWHGDFVPWNLSCGTRRIAVWDWERFAEGVPCGFDRLHLHLQVAVHRRNLSIPAALGELDTRLGELLDDIEPQQRRLVRDAYLAELLVRYEHDLAEQHHEPLAAWCDELTRALAGASTSR